MKKNIKELVHLSKTKGRLDPKKIQRIASYLTRSSLGKYLLFLKIERVKEKVLVESSVNTAWLSKNLSVYFKKLFPSREIEFIQNPELVSGIKISVDNNVFDATAKGVFERVLLSYDYDR